MARTPTSFFLIVLLFVAGLSFAGDATLPPWEGEHFSAPAAVFYQAAAQVPVTPDADVMVLEEEQSSVFEGDGRATTTYYLVFKVATQHGAENWADVSLGWAPWHMEHPVIRARVITPDLVEHTLDPKTIADTPARGEDKIYSDRRVLRAPLPAIAPGVVVEEEFVTRESAPLFGAGVVDNFYFSRSVPVLKARLRLDAPATLPVSYKTELLPDVKPERTEQGGRVRIVFEAGPLQPEQDIPDYLPADVPGYPQIRYSTGASWQEVAETYSKIVDEKIASADVRGQVKGLVAGQTTREEKIAAILQELNRQVRYTGIEFGDSAIIPHPPSETWGRKYGDCKDKSVLLVALLRAAGIPAHLALLNSGFGFDVEAALPGMGAFDHAIVYAPGASDFWIDATDEYARLGQVPSADQGRLALVVRAGEKGLRLIPGSSASDNLLVEKREFYLAESGPARVVEISEPHGSLESSYRESYGDKENKDTKNNLESYVKAQYLAEKLDRYDRSDPTDSLKPFQLVIEASSARRGFTDLDSAVVAVRLETLFNRLPASLQRRETTDEKKEVEAGKTKKRTHDYDLRMAFVTEWNYKIVPPAGFRPKPLPKSEVISLGPAKLTKEFSADANGTVKAVFRFDTVKRRYTLAEATELRNKVAELSAGQALFLYFEPVADALFHEGKIRESYQAYRDLIGLHPKEAVHHLQLAKALLESGFGQAARDEAKLATKIEPTSGLAQKTLADILQHDLVGRKFRRGSDYADAATAFRAARTIDPKDKALAGNLAILLEYNGEGERYGPGAKLKEAIAEYRSVTPEELAEVGLKANPAYALFYGGEYEEAMHYAETLNPRPTAITVGAVAMLNGSDRAMEEARKRTGGEVELKDTLRTAGEMLMRAGKYAVAAELLQNGASGDGAARTLGLAAMLRRAKPRSELQLPDDARGRAIRLMLLMTDPALTIEKLKGESSKNANTVMDETDAETIRQTMRAARQVRTQLSRSGLPADVLLDLVVPLIDESAEGSDATGYRVTLRVPNAKEETFYLVKEEGRYLLLDTSQKPNAIGLEILDRVAGNDLAAARQMLDWVRESQHLAGGDDPFDGNPFPRFWTQGKDGNAAQMKLAAAALLAQTKPTAKRGLAILEPARAQASTDAEKLNLDLALLSGYILSEQFERALQILDPLAGQNPESKRLFRDRAIALIRLGRWSDADQYADERLSRKPQDLDALRILIGSAVAREDYKRAHSFDQKLLASGKAEAGDLNNSAWHALYTGAVTDADVDTAVRAAQMSQDSAGVLHTLACVYAEVGKTKEARELLLQAMDKLNLDEPDAPYWYAFGRLAEQYGLKEIALAHYSRVEKPKEAFQIPDSSYRLAQTRLAGLR